MAEENVSRPEGMNGNPAKYSALCRRVESTAGFVPTTPKEFDRLGEAIFRHTGSLLSSTTLKRLWGYLAEEVTTRRSTLDILARYCGWSSYEDFLKGDLPDAESGPVGTTALIAERDMHRGERLRLLWAPGRVCDIEYVGQGEWKVTDSEGTRLQAGDRFKVAVIAAGEPLYLHDLTHAGDPAGIYVCGRRSGVSFLRL